MIRAELIAKGDVQRVGYRDFVQKVAINIGIKGYVENLKDGTVKIVCEAEKEKIEEFMKMIKVEVGLIKVTSIELIKTSPATGEFKYFEIKYGPLEEELSERMVAAINYAAAMWSDIKEMKGDIKEMKSDIKEMKSDIKEVLKKQDETIIEIRNLRKDLKTYMDKRFERIEKEIKLIKQKIGLT